LVISVRFHLNFDQKAWLSGIRSKNKKTRIIPAKRKKGPGPTTPKTPKKRKLSSEHVEVKLSRKNKRGTTLLAELEGISDDQLVSASSEDDTLGEPWLEDQDNEYIYEKPKSQPSYGFCWCEVKHSFKGENEIELFKKDAPIVFCCSNDEKHLFIWDSLEGENDSSSQGQRLLYKIETSSTPNGKECVAALKKRKFDLAEAVQIPEDDCWSQAGCIQKVCTRKNTYWVYFDSARASAKNVPRAYHAKELRRFEAEDRSTESFLAMKYMRNLELKTGTRKSKRLRRRKARKK